MLGPAFGKLVTFVRRIIETPAAFVDVQTVPHAHRWQIVMYTAAAVKMADNDN
jgi:hypothetical protein